MLIPKWYDSWNSQQQLFSLIKLQFDAPKVEIKIYSFDANIFINSIKISVVLAFVICPTLCGKYFESLGQSLKVLDKGSKSQSIFCGASTNWCCIAGGGGVPWYAGNTSVTLSHSCLFFISFSTLPSSSFSFFEVQLRVQGWQNIIQTSSFLS